MVPKLARAAVDGGADLLRVHVNVRHQASGTVFGSLRRHPRRAPMVEHADVDAAN
jgi:hypothetical protein